MISDFSRPWTPVALTADLPVATVLPIATPAGRYALWRSQSGKLTASAERCPHRGMRLTHGFVRGELLSCIYHGWSFDQTGRCRKIPAHPDLEPPESIGTATQTVVEQGGVIWAASAETDQLPPAFSGFAPLRTISINALPAAIIAAAAGSQQADGSVSLVLAGVPALLLFNCSAEGVAQVHVLVSETADLAQTIAASRALETVRRAAEAGLEVAA